MLTLKRHGRWQSDSVAEQYVSESVYHQVSVAKKFAMDPWLEHPVRQISLLLEHPMELIFAILQEILLVRCEMISKFYRVLRLIVR